MNLCKAIRTIYMLIHNKGSSLLTLRNGHAKKKKIERREAQTKEWAYMNQPLILIFQ